MKKILYILSAVLLLAGCEKYSEISEDGELTVPRAEYKISAYTQSDSDTKLDIDGTVVKWTSGDRIYIAEIGENDKFSNLYSFYIDSESISEDGKSADFYGETLESGKQYLAVRSSYGAKILEDIESYQSFNVDGLLLLYGYTSTSQLLDDCNLHIGSHWKMLSPVFEVDAANSCQIGFSNISSYFNLNIMMDDDVTEEYQLATVTVSAPAQMFREEACINTNREIVPYLTNSVTSTGVWLSNSEENDAVISSNKSYTVNIPFFPNEDITEVSGDFTITITTSDSTESSVTVPAKLLTKNKVYTKDLKFPTPVDVISSDRAALIELYNATDGNNWANNTNWCTDAPLEDWYGVNVNYLNGRVNYLYLVNNNLNGYIPESIGDLTNLITLILQSNNLSGGIPETIGNLNNLTKLSLTSNNLSGAIPETIGNLNNLTDLDLNINNLSGAIPESIGNLNNLTYLVLYTNNLSGAIPETIGNLNNLIYFRSSSNNLSGTIPETIGNLANLTDLDLSWNNLSGAIPESIGNLANLTDLDLSRNNLSGTIPESIGNLTNLTDLSLTYNYLIGPLPEALSDSSALANAATNWGLTPQYSGYGFDVTEEPFVEISPTDFSTFSSNYSATTISIVTNRSWTVSTNSTWVTFDVYSGENSYDLTVNIDANRTFEERTATITINLEGVEKVLYITQEAWEEVSLPDFGEDVL